MSKFSSKLTRRHLIQLAAAAGGAGLASSFWPYRQVRSATSEPVAPADRKLLFVFCAYGGASIIDSFMPVVDTDVPDPKVGATLNVFPASLVEQPSGSNIRAVRPLDDYAYYAKPKTAIGDLLTHHGRDLVVMAHEVSSVNHTVGQQRSLNGAGFDRGRTIMETMAMRHGAGMPLPSCNMAAEGYLRHGSDPSVPPEARHELITTPQLFAAGTHGFQSIPGAPDEKALGRARALRAELDRDSAFGRTFQNDPRLAMYLRQREVVVPQLEQAKLIQKLLLLDRSQIDPKYQIESDPISEGLRESLPEMASDRAQAQIALGFLMAYHGVSTSITMGFNTEPAVESTGAIVSSPIAFDFSHNLHRIVQSLMWCRTTALVDTLISLLKTHDYMGDPALGKMWDRSLVYIATEFGRDKKRPSGASSWGTSHHLNNGSVLISPRLRGNAVYGGVDPMTGLTYGFDPETGEPDKTRTFFESDVYSVIAQALDLQVPSARAFPALVKSA